MRCCNRSHDCTPTCHTGQMLFVVTAMWMSNQRSKMEGMLETEWRDHFTYEKQSASRVMYQAPNKTKSNDPGINIYEEEETLKEYMDDEVQLVLTSQKVV